MDKDLFDRVLQYRTSMAAIKGMLLKGIITEDEYAHIDRIIANKYGLDLSIIYR